MEELIDQIGQELLPSQARETYETLAKIFGNILKNPTEVKFRTLKKDNKVIAAKVLRSKHAASLLLALGFDDEGGAYTCPAVDVDTLSTAVDLLNCMVLTMPEEPKEEPAEAAPATAVASGAAAVAVGGASALAAKPSVVENPQGFKRRDDAEAKRQAQMDQLQAARAAKGAEYVENPSGPPPPAPSAAAGYPSASAAEESANAKKKPATAFDFQDRGKKEQEKNKAAMSLEEMRRAQKEKFKDWKSDPNAKEQEAYKMPPSVAGGAKVEDNNSGWFGGLFGGGWGGSSSGSKPTQKPQDRKPNIKGVADLPKPPPRAG